MNNIHVKDAASAMLTVFEVALENGAEEGAEGLCCESLFTLRTSERTLKPIDFACSMEAKSRLNQGDGRRETSA